MFRDAFAWPNDHFVPDDPIEVMAFNFHAYADGLDDANLIIEIERMLGVGAIEQGWWDQHAHGTFGELVITLDRLRVERRAASVVLGA